MKEKELGLINHASLKATMTLHDILAARDTDINRFLSITLLLYYISSLVGALTTRISLHCNVCDAK